MRKKEADAVKEIRQSMTTYYQPTKLPNGESPKEREAQQPAASGRSWQKKLLLSVGLLVLALLVPVLIILFMDWRNFSSAAGKLFGSSSLMDMFPTSRLQTSPEDNVHVLVAGYSADDPGHGGATLTDTIMVLNVNKHTGKGYMLSIPRDLYVQIPGNGSAKINEVYQDGESDEFSEPGYPPGGMGLLTKTAEEVTGLDIHYNFLVNYAAVRDMTDALGGIEVNISSPDQRGVYDPGFKPTEGGALKLPNGTNKIDGETALKITRARGLAAGSYGYPQADFKPYAISANTHDGHS
jgi:LCP family protein required for cell wall assembly